MGGGRKAPRDRQVYGRHSGRTRTDRRGAFLLLFEGAEEKVSHMAQGTEDQRCQRPSAHASQRTCLPHRFRGRAVRQVKFSAAVQGSRRLHATRMAQKES